MRVSDEMVMAAVGAIYGGDRDELLTPNVMVRRVREGLETALADVPGPSEDVSSVATTNALAELVAERQERIAELEAQAQAMADVVVTLQARIAELEAKLERVREWAERDAERVDVLDILDWQEDP